MKKLISTTLFAMALSGCATPPPTPANQLADIDLCIAGGRAHETGDTARFNEISNEAEYRIASGHFSLNFNQCQDYAQQGINAVDQERVESAQNAARWQNFSAGMSAAAAQINQQNAYQQQQADIQMQQAQATAQHMQDEMAEDRRNRALINAINGNGF